MANDQTNQASTSKPGNTGSTPTPAKPASGSENNGTAASSTNEQPKAPETGTNDVKNNQDGKDVAKNDEAGTVAAGDLAGTSRQAHDNHQQNNQMLNPDVENAAGNAAAPGVVPSNQVNQAPAPTDLTAAEVGNEPKPHTANPNNKPAGEYTLTRGKHRYVKDGEEITARPGDSVPLTDKQYEGLKDRFTPNSKL